MIPPKPQNSRKYKQHGKLLTKKVQIETQKKDHHLGKLIQEVPITELTDKTFQTRLFRQDFSDINYIKHKIWEEANKTGGVTGRYFVQAFDGNFLRHGLEVFGNDEVFWLMGQAVAFWNSNGSPYSTEAVIVTNKNWGPKLRIIYAKGKDISKRNLWIEFDSINDNPGNDRQLAQKIKRELESKKEKQDTLF